MYIYVLGHDNVYLRRCGGTISARVNRAVV